MSCSRIGACVISGKIRYHIAFRTRAQRMFFPMLPLRVTPRWGYPGWEWATTPPADAGGYQNYVPSGRSWIFKCERARKKREGSWLISIRLAENFGLHLRMMV
jgi:hypothetical protein